MWTLKELVEGDNEELIEKLDWYILPVHNPDGYFFSGKWDRLWRKTRSCKGDDHFLDNNYEYYYKKLNYTITNF